MGERIIIMEKSQRPPRHVRRRLRKTAAKLVEDSSVRVALTDEQAKQLLAWGKDQMNAEAMRTAEWPDEAAMPRLEKKVTAVRTVMLLINKLVRAAGSTEDSESKMNDLIKNLSWLAGKTNTFGYMQHARKFQLHQFELDEATAFQQLMEIVQLQSSTEEE